MIPGYRYQTEGGKRSPPTSGAPKQGRPRQEDQGARGAQGGPPPRQGRGRLKEATPTPAQEEGAPPGDPTQKEREREGEQQNRSFTPLPLVLPSQQSQESGLGRIPLEIH